MSFIQLFGRIISYQFSFHSDQHMEKALVRIHQVTGVNKTGKFQNGKKSGLRFMQKDTLLIGTGHENEIPCSKGARYQIGKMFLYSLQADGEPAGRAGRLTHEPHPPPLLLTGERLPGMRHLKSFR